MNTTDPMLNSTGSPPSPAAVVPLVQCGEFTLSRVDGMLWLQHKSGEGMQVNEDALEWTLREFFHEQF